ncbi:MAG: HEAT repeat domain-containing protein [Spirochaetales bacterium]|nr:HEAT repeat domain-containing protein [Spirochaetales bacterium]
MLTQFLTEEEKQYSQKKVYKFQALNGMGFNFLGETPVYLMAMNFGATNMELGYISSVIFLSGFILVFLPKLLAGRNLIKVQSTAWFLRGMFVLAYLALYFIEGRSAVTLILIVYTLFCTARMVGVVIWNPLIKMVTNSQNRGTVLAQGNIANQSASVVSKLISFIITSFKLFSGITGILLLQIFGVIFNTAAVVQLRKIPCRESVEYKKSRNIFVILKESIKIKNRRYPLLIRWISVAIMVINGLTIVFLRKEAGFSANIVFLYTMILAFANILSGLFAKTFADRVGSRPLLIGINILLTIFFAIWMIIPLSIVKSLPIFMFFILGFFSNFFLLSTNVLVDRVVVNSMPESDSFGYNSMVNFVTAFFSLLSGIGGGLLIDLGQNSLIPIPNTFSFLFLLALILSLILVVLSMWILDRGSLSARETAAILFSLEGLKAYSDIGKLNTIDDPVKQKTVILSISQNDANIATEEMRSIISSPLSPLKGEVIKSLFSHPREALLDDLIKEAADYGSYHQMKAIFALGAYRDKRVEKLLIELLDSPDSWIRSNAAKSLGRIGNTSHLEKIQSLSLMCTTAWDKINYLIALKNIDHTGTIFKNIFNTPRSFSTGIFRQTYYSLVADLFDFKPQLSGVYSSKNLKKGEGLKLFLEQTRDLNHFNTNHKNLIQWFSTNNWNKIWDFCLNTICLFSDNLKVDTPISNLYIAVEKESNNRIFLTDEDSSVAYDDALSAVYFTYQIAIRGYNEN